MEKVSFVLLAGGKSSRFGRDKSLLTIDGRPLVEATIEKCRPLFDELFVSSNAENKFGISGICELSDTYKDSGPMSGIHSGLTASRNEAVFFAACDMPYFNAELAAEIISRAEGSEICIPIVGGKSEPLFGVYKKRLLPIIEELLKEGVYSIRALLEKADTCYFDCTEWLLARSAQNAFYNINYQEDLSRLNYNPDNSTGRIK